MPKLTKRTIEAVPVKDKDYFVWDSEMPGFGIRVMSSGKKSFMVQYRHGKRTRRITFGRVGVMTPDEARQEARELLAAAGKGDNPAEAVQTYRKASTMAEVCERFMTEHAEKHCKVSTQKEYRRSIELFVIPALGTRKIVDVSRADISRLHTDMKHIPYQANRTLGVLSKLFQLCEAWNLRPDGSNPCRHVKKFKEEKRERFLSPEEFVRLFDILDEVEADGSETASAINAFRLLMLTGCRLGEIQTLKWDFIKDDILELPDTKTGARKVYLGDDARAVLHNVTRLPDNPFVITGAKDGHFLTDFQKPWRRIRAKARLDDVRIHDLRHSFASAAVSNGMSLAMVGKLLGHSQPQTTARYAHLADDPMKNAANIVTGIINANRKNGSSC